MGTLKLNDGTEIVGYCIESSGLLFLYMYEISLSEAFELLIDPEKTVVITEESFGKEKIVEGYNKLRTVTDEMNGMITASLMKTVE